MHNYIHGDCQFQYLCVHCFYSCLKNCRLYTRTYIHTYTHTPIHTYIHTPIHPYIHTYMYCSFTIQVTIKDLFSKEKGGIEYIFFRIENRRYLNVIVTQNNTK